ncbi:hypothetical protein AZE99_12940 [Sphingorhabdus sp. M41]|nr:hypothetical protein AZE99_12940 [Sphingorhabdus sp. M41]
MFTNWVQISQKISILGGGRMQEFSNIYIIDKSLERRSDVCRKATSANFVAQPFANIEELGNRWPKSGYFLIADEHGALEDLVSGIKESGEYLPIISYRPGPSPTDVLRSMRAGSIDYLAYPFQSAELVESITRIEREWKSVVARNRDHIYATRRIGTLSEREFSVLRCMSIGSSNKGIARELGISPRTVEIHRANLIDKLNVENTVNAIRLNWEASQSSVAKLNV